MPVRRKVFRIEEMLNAGAGDDLPPPEHQHLLAEIAALRDLIERAGSGRGNNADTTARDGIETERLRQLRDDTNSIHRAISRTKEEIAALHVHALNAPEGSRAARELDAVIGGTERAIQQILAAAEDIDEAANTLSAALRQEREQALAHDIRDQVVRIFEACNFQDLAGQRIGKVLATLKFVEERVAHMMQIWGGIDAFRAYTVAARVERGQGSDLLNGPKLDGDLGHSSQAEIDALFDSD